MCHLAPLQILLFSTYFLKGGTGMGSNLSSPSPYEKEATRETGLLVASCPNCGRETQRGAKFCPQCGQDLSVVVPQDQRIPTEDVPVPPPPLEATGRSPGRRRWLLGGLVGCGGLLFLLLAIFTVAIVSAPSNKTAQSGGGEKEDAREENKNTPKTKTVATAAEVGVGETAELRD